MNIGRTEKKMCYAGRNSNSLPRVPKIRTDE